MQTLHDFCFESLSLMSPDYVAPFREELLFVGAEDIGHFEPMFPHGFGATVTLINEDTGDQRSAATNSTGDFTFAALLPAPYTVRVESKGFERLEKKGNVLTASQRLSVGTLQLTVGAVTETVTVAATGVAVQTSSAESSALLDTTQMASLSQRGRDVADMLRILPGVATNATEDESISPGGQGSTIPNIGGVGGSYGSMSLDGTNGADAGTLPSSARTSHGEFVPSWTKAVAAG